MYFFYGENSWLPERPYYCAGNVLSWYGTTSEYKLVTVWKMWVD